MRKRIIIGLAMGMVVVFLSGCGGGGKPSPTPTAEAVPSATAATPAPSPNSSTGITVDQAEAIALKDAGITKADTKAMKVEQGTENGRSVYEVSFKANTKDYDYDIDTSSGEIVKRDIEIDN
ncbi:MAG: PepSY domain-containing protein [Eubacterium sp.]